MPIHTKTRIRTLPPLSLQVVVSKLGGDNIAKTKLLVHYNNGIITAALFREGSEAMVGKKATRKTALQVAEAFLNLPNVKAVDVFGSVAHSGRGNDLDLVIVVGPMSFTSYVLIRQKWSRFERLSRLVVVGETLALPSAHKEWLLQVDKQTPLDLYLLPENWQEQAAVIQEMLPFKDQKLLANIARSAVRLEVKKADQPGRWGSYQPYWPMSK